VKIGLGIVTCDRHSYFDLAVHSVVEHLSDAVDEVAVYDDGDHLVSMDTVTRLREVGDGWHYYTGTGRLGVGHAKNDLLRHLMAQGCDYLFLMEDDIVVKSRRAIEEYVEASLTEDCPVLMFHGHGDRNPPIPTRQGNSIAFWPQAVGAWTMYRRDELDEFGLMDPGFPRNCLEHVEHAARILVGSGWHGHPEWPDVFCSDAFLAEIPGSTINRAIVEDEGAFEAAKAYWKEQHPDTYLWDH
jgi:hypothetical protein